METCPNCKAKLNIDEKSSGKCFSCGTSFESSLPKENNRISYSSADNTTAKAIKICGIIIIFLGTILSFFVSGGDGQKYQFSLLQFLASEAICVISGLVFIGISEIIQLLEDIKNKMK